LHTEYAQAVPKDYVKYAKDAHYYNVQASRSSAGHSRDLEDMKRVSTEASDNLKQGKKRQRQRESKLLAQG